MRGYRKQGFTLDELQMAFTVVKELNALESLVRSDPTADVTAAVNLIIANDELAAAVLGDERSNELVTFISELPVS